MDNSHGVHVRLTGEQRLCVMAYFVVDGPEYTAEVEQRLMGAVAEAVDAKPIKLTGLYIERADDVTVQPVD